LMCQTQEDTKIKLVCHTYGGHNIIDALQVRRIL